MLTIGVEEEFLLLHPDGAVAPAAAELIDRARAPGELTPEFMAFQLETATRVCSGLEDLLHEVTRLRLLAANAAERLGVRLVAAGMPPYAAGLLGEFSQDPRYRELSRRFPQAHAAGGACACQVHVGIPDRELRVEVLARLRPWLSTLLALTANSAIVGGVDSGWSSRRYRELLQWPTFRPPGVWPDASGYDRTVRALIARGAAYDAASVYFLARLSPRYPTIEVRVADACLTAEDTLLLAAVVRALVSAVIDDIRARRFVRPESKAQLRAALLSAAHQGLGLSVTPRVRSRSRTASPWLIARLQERIAPALKASGDGEIVERGLDRLRRVGTGADRQRSLWVDAMSSEAFVAALADATAGRTR